jgi:hypothetical protein
MYVEILWGGEEKCSTNRQNECLAKTRVFSKTKVENIATFVFTKTNKQTNKQTNPECHEIE